LNKEIKFLFKENPTLINLRNMYNDSNEIIFTMICIKKEAI